MNESREKNNLNLGVDWQEANLGIYKDMLLFGAKLMLHVHVCYTCQWMCPS